jgi:hypothetical protein
LAHRFFSLSLTITNLALNRLLRSHYFCIFGVEIEKNIIMSEAEMNSYRLTSMEEPGDERMAQIMHEVAEGARENTRRAAERVAAGIEAATRSAQDKWGVAINRIKNGSK